MAAVPFATVADDVARVIGVVLLLCMLYVLLFPRWDTPVWRSPSRASRHRQQAAPAANEDMRLVSRITAPFLRLVHPLQHMHHQDSD